MPAERDRLRNPAAPQRVAVTGLGVVSALGRGPDETLRGLLAGEPAFAPVTRFDVARRRVGIAAQAADAGSLADELCDVVRHACDRAGLDRTQRAAAPLLLARHADAAAARQPVCAATSTGATAVQVADACGLSHAERTYTSACVAASSAVADGAALIAHGRQERVVVAAGYLVDEDNLALFDAGRALAADGRLRPFSAGRRGLLLGDGVAAVVLESESAAERRGAEVLARVAGWGRAGDAYHVCQPDPEGRGMARAITAALTRAGIEAADLGYVNAHGTGTPYNDAAEAAALHRALGADAERLPLSSTKSLHGHTLEASGLLELIVTILALRAGRLPINAGFLGPDEQCRLNLIRDEARTASPSYALSLNAAFGGANTALVVGAA